MAKLVNFKDADIGRRAEKQWHFCAYWCQNGDGENVKSGWIYGCKGYEKFRCTNLGQLMGVSKYTIHLMLIIQFITAPKLGKFSPGLRINQYSQ